MERASHKLLTVFYDNPHKAGVSSELLTHINTGNGYKQTTMSRSCGKPWPFRVRKKAGGQVYALIKKVTLQELASVWQYSANKGSKWTAKESHPLPGSKWKVEG